MMPLLSAMCFSFSKGDGRDRTPTRPTGRVVGSGMNTESRKLTTLMTIEPHSAGQNPSIVMPVLNSALAHEPASMSIDALMTSMNSPKVAMMQPHDRKLRIGRMIALTKPSTSASRRS